MSSDNASTSWSYICVSRSCHHVDRRRFRRRFIFPALRANRSLWDRRDVPRRGTLALCCFTAEMIRMLDAKHQNVSQPRTLDCSVDHKVLRPSVIKRSRRAYGRPYHFRMVFPQGCTDISRNVGLLCSSLLCSSFERATSRYSLLFSLRLDLLAADTRREQESHTWHWRNGWEIHYEHAKRDGAPPLLFLPGFGVGTFHFKRNIQEVKWRVCLRSCLPHFHLAR